MVRRRRRDQQVVVAAAARRRMVHQPSVHHLPRSLPDDVVLHELLVLVHPRLHSSVLCVVDWRRVPLVVSMLMVVVIMCMWMMMMVMVIVLTTVAVVAVVVLVVVVQRVAMIASNGLGRLWWRRTGTCSSCCSGT